MREQIAGLKEELDQYRRPLQQALQVRNSSNFVINAEQLQRLLDSEFHPKRHRKE